jgi:hypothetical protein
MEIEKYGNSGLRWAGGGSQRLLLISLFLYFAERISVGGNNEIMKYGNRGER